LPNKTYVKGLEGLQKALDKYGEAVDKELSDHVNITSQKIRGEAIKLIQHGTKTGRVYKRGQKGRKRSDGNRDRRFKQQGDHRASAKGEAPATDTGHLVSKIFSSFKGMKAEVKSNAKYSNYLEITLERPFMIPAMESQRKYWRNGIINIVKYKNRKGRK
jgi:hypothetical protein